MPNKIRCLLIAPLANGEGFSGEDAYTQSLLNYPPEGVEYIFHDDLVASGQGWRVPWVHRLFPWLGERRLHILPYTWVQSLGTNERFDLIHIHGWAVYLTGGLKDSQTPIVISASSAPTYGLKAYKGWSDWRVRRYTILMRFLQKKLRIYDSYFSPGPARRIVVWSKWARNDYIRAGIEKSRLCVVPPGLPAPELIPRVNKDQVRLLFVGNDFVRKGGFFLLEVFGNLRARFGKKISLTIVSNYNEHVDMPAGVSWLRGISHSTMGKLYQEHDIFVLPTLAEGYGISVLEAMSYGLPVIVSGVGALPEIVVDEKTGFVVQRGDNRQLEGRIASLVKSQNLMFQMGDQARKRFEKFFSIEARNEALRQLYYATANCRDGYNAAPKT